MMEPYPTTKFVLLLVVKEEVVVEEVEYNADENRRLETK